VRLRTGWPTTQWGGQCPSVALFVVCGVVVLLAVLPVYAIFTCNGWKQSVCMMGAVTWSEDVSDMLGWHRIRCHSRSVHACALKAEVACAYEGQS
jgi:hypothetical protein